ncbi:hypothetical protein F5883DRAFT_577839 [Diaporthe sp. PMI_573]|nr:hypothetical protein F5883DRAFT_577839 [Diaporthaceae sp. PMI_573]
MEHQPRAAKRKFGFEGEDDKTTSIRRIKSCSPLTSTILEETGDENGRDDTESFTEEQQKFLLEVSVARLDESLGWWEIFDLFTSLHPWHPFTQAEMRQECLDLEFRAKQDQPPDFELHGDFDSLFPLPQLKTKGEGDRVRPQALAPPSFTSEHNKRIIHLAYKPQKNNQGWEEFYNTISTEFPCLTEKEVRQQYLHLRMQRNYDIGVKLFPLMFVSLSARRCGSFHQLPRSFVSGLRSSARCKNPSSPTLPKGILCAYARSWSLAARLASGKLYSRNSRAETRATIGAMLRICNFTTCTLRLNRREESALSCELNLRSTSGFFLVWS